jgi:hypothetical protein
MKISDIINWFRRKPKDPPTLEEQVMQVHKDMKDGKIKLKPLYEDHVDLSRFRGYIK